MLSLRSRTLASRPAQGVMGVDLYCERVGPDLGAELVNAATNVAFLLAAWAASNLGRRQGVRSVEVWVLIGLCAVIGVGSGIFHTFATNWARLLDVIPILLFQLMYLWVYGRRMVHISRFYTAVLLTTFLLVGLWTRQFAHLLNGSVMYLPALLFLVVIGSYHRLTQRIEPWVLLYAASVFVLSLAFRSIDLIVCPGFPLGTHFLWHILNGVLLYLLLRGLIVNLTEAEGGSVLGTRDAGLHPNTDSRTPNPVDHGGT